MRNINFREQIQVFRSVNPSLTYDQLGTLLLIEDLYQSIPDDVELFRKLYRHLDPGALEQGANGISLIKFARSEEPAHVLRDRLNQYFNIKFNYVGHYQDYDRNMLKFREFSEIVSGILHNLLEIARFPVEVIQRLGELPDVAKCSDAVDLLELYKHAADRRVQFEVLRKLGLIVLISRIVKCHIIPEIQVLSQSLESIFKQGLGFQAREPQEVFYWMDSRQCLVRFHDREEAFNAYQADLNDRNVWSQVMFPLQTYTLHPAIVSNGQEILHMELRNKLVKNGKPHFTSFVEKVVRKNLQYPNQVRDVIGVKILVRDEDEIPQLIELLESFLGGSSTRKEEKNSLHKFGRRRISEFSSKDYYVWKAVYDVALPHPSLLHLDKMIQLTRGNAEAQAELQARREYFQNKPKDCVVEVQLQDVDSYLLSNVKGSPSEHARLKMNQIRHNSFFKFFPREIYEPVLLELRDQLLRPER